MIVAQNSKVVQARCNVLEGTRPTATQISQPAVGEVPCRETLFGQGICHRGHAGKILESGGPATPVHQHGHRVRARACRQPKVPELQRSGAIGLYQIRFAGGCSRLGQSQHRR